MNLTALPAFSDNYIWMLDDGREAVVVDPGEAAPVESALDARALALVGILVTHHHPDHVGGVDALRKRLRGPVYGPAREGIPEPFAPLVDGDEIALLGLRFRVIDVPGHTAGHIAYFTASGPQPPVLFCGDTLFNFSIGRTDFPGGDYGQLMESIHGKLMTLADDTRVLCGHGPETTVGFERKHNPFVLGLV